MKCGKNCAKNCDKKDLLLYAVTDRSWLGNETLYRQVEKTLKGGATFIQLREKHLDDASFLEEAVELKELCRRYHVPFVINDNVEIALKMDADGVHVGQSDMEAGNVREKLGPDKIIGVSAQTVEQAVLAEQRGADYLGVGAVFPTGSKDDADDVSHETLKARHLRHRGDQRHLRAARHRGGDEGTARSHGRDGEPALSRAIMEVERGTLPCS